MKGVAHVDVEAADIGPAPRKLGKHEGTDQRDQSAKRPCDQN